MKAFPLESKKDIRKWLDKMSVYGYTINDDLTVDVDIDVNLSQKMLKAIPIQFGIVKGSFICSSNELTTLKGSPHTCYGYFICSKNKLTNLEGAPSKVSMDFECNDNELTTLKGTLLEVGQNFRCHDNQLTNLDYLPHLNKGSITFANNNLNNINAITHLSDQSFSLINFDNNPNLKDFSALKALLAIERLSLSGTEIKSILALDSINITKSIHHTVKDKKEAIVELKNFYHTQHNQFVLSSISIEEYYSILEKTKLELNMTNQDSKNNKKIKI